MIQEVGLDFSNSPRTDVKGIKKTVLMFLHISRPIVKASPCAQKRQGTHRTQPGEAADLFSVIKFIYIPEIYDL